MNGSTPNRQKRLLGLVLGATAVLLLLAGIWLIASRSSTKENLAVEEGPNRPASMQNIVRSACQICGYKTLPPDSLYCPICYVELSEEERITWEYSSIDEMIHEEQSMFFAAEGYKDSVSFFQPLNWQTGKFTFEKDTAWRPVVTAQEVQKLRDTLLRAGVIIQ